jgi:hypothetical protein
MNNQNFSEKIEAGAMLIAAHIYTSSPNLLPETIAQAACEIAEHVIFAASKYSKFDDSIELVNVMDNGEATS